MPAPEITGTKAGQSTVSEAPVDPFEGVTVSDPNIGATDTLTITLNGSGGTLTGAGLNGSNGSYTLSGSASAITNELDALTFTPTAGQLNTSGATTFTLSDSSTGYTVPEYASTPKVLASFNGADGSGPSGSLMMDAAGNLFSTTHGGGPSGADSYGTIFEIAKTSSGYGNTPTVLAGFSAATFSAATRGAAPFGGLIMDAAGNLFGTAIEGGQKSVGTVFEIAKIGSGYSGTPLVLASFDGAHGAFPLGSLIMDAAGDLFGTTEGGGTNNKGAVFEIAKNSSGYSSTPTVLVSFNGADGSSLNGSLLMDSVGDLFGTTGTGGAYGDGTAFEITKIGNTYSSTPAVLTSFNGADGLFPETNLIMDAAGDLFGTTSQGGSKGLGAVFEILKTGSGYSSAPTVLASFDGADGANPSSGLIMDAAGDLYGATAGGGTNNDGALFEITKDSSGYSSTPVMLASFNGADGAGSVNGLITDALGDLLGTTGEGGAYGDGTVFKLSVATQMHVATIDSTTVVNSDPLASPTVSITSAAEASNVVNQTIVGAVASGDMAAVVGQTVTLKDNGANLGTATVAADGTFEASVALPNQSANSIVATVTDSYGNTSSSAAVEDTLDDIPPTVTITTAAEAGNVAIQTISGNVISGGTAAVAGQIVALTDNGTTLGAATVAADGTFTAAVTLPNQGANCIVATVTDSYGNTSDSAAVVDTLDDILPTVTITSAREASYVANQTISGTVASGGAAVVAGQTVTLMDNGGSVGTATVAADGTFTAAVTLPNQGANSIVATVTDSYGNTGSSTAVVDTLGSVPPTITGTMAGQATTSETPIDPFQGVTIGDLNVGATDTLTITLNGAGGALSGTDLIGSDGAYTLSGIASTITSELDALTFTPTTGEPNTSSTTTFTLSDVSTGYTAPTYASTPTALASFNGSNGIYPQGSLIMDGAGNLIGTAEFGGARGVGAVFEITKTGDGYSGTPTALASFSSGTGIGPNGGLTTDAAGDLFGMAAQGGADNDGVIFEIAKTGGYRGTPEVLASFNGADGAEPGGSLIMDAAGDLFGSTELGGANSDGSVFELDNTGSGYSSTPTVLASFDGIDGLYPSSSLIMDTAGDLFGTTLEAGANGDGTVFEIAKTDSGYSSTPMLLASFGGTDGRYLSSSLIIDATGDLFGTAEFGGANNSGAVFEIAKTSSGYSATPTVLASFDGTHGVALQGGLIMDGVGDLFGTAAFGGASNDGALFEITKTAGGYGDTPIMLASFNGSDGQGAIGSLLMDAAGDLFGTTDGGGAKYDGVVFELARGLMPIATVDSTTTVVKSDPAVPPIVNTSLATFNNSDSVSSAAQDNNAIAADGSSLGSISLASASAGQVTINDNATSDATNELEFTGYITDQNLWFLQSGNNLKIDVLGTNTSVTVNGWFSSNSSQLQEIAAGGLKIDSQISQLVQAMAVYSASNPGFDPSSSNASFVPNDANLQNAVGAAWHA